MSLTIETGAGVANANSYATVAEADAYLANHTQAVAWAALATPQKESLLIQAARVIDNAVAWKGYKAGPDQPMQWPRVGIPYTGPWLVGFTNFNTTPGYYPPDRIPPELKSAQFEMMALLMQGDRLADPQGSGLKSVGLGSGALTVEFDVSTAPRMVGEFIPGLLRAFINSAGGNGPRQVKARRA